MTAPLFTKPAKGKLCPTKNPLKGRSELDHVSRKALASVKVRARGKI